MKKYVFIDWNETEAGYGVKLRGYFPQNASPYGIRLKAHKPIIDKAPILVADKEWESFRIGCYCSASKIDGKYYLWYTSIVGDNVIDNYHSMLCLAVSDDGINWEKPALGVYDFNGNTKTNIVRNGPYPMDCADTVFYDVQADESQRYKLIFTRWVDGENNERYLELIGMTSKDGIHWENEHTVMSKLGGDTQSSLFYDDLIRKYVIYTKGCKGFNGGRRSILRAVSDKFSDFVGEGMVANAGDFSKDAAVDLYTSSCIKWPGADNAYLMIPAAYHRTTDTIRPIFGISRDGIRWSFPIDENWIENTEKIPSIYPGVGVVDNADGTWSFYLGESTINHNCPNRPNNSYLGMIRRATIREDGFMSIRADSLGMFCTSREFSFESNEVRINANCDPSGYIKVAVADTNTTEEIEYFSAKDCRLEKINNAWYNVKWNKPLEQLDKRKKYRLKFHIFSADIYSFMA